MDTGSPLDDKAFFDKGTYNVAFAIHRDALQQVLVKAASGARLALGMTAAATLLVSRRSGWPLARVCAIR